ncbi:hypothetical protein D7I39_10015 [Allopusillimonas ginsengisoli]|nr:hypothetical protein D7I39_10015 [Allopusillimonas ginsengisoli]
MKIKIIGRRYSKIRTAAAESDDDVTTLIRFLGEHSVKPQTWRDQAQDAHDAGCAYLQSKGLPAAARIFRWGDMKEWSIEPPATTILDQNTKFEGRSITNHVAKEGYERDSQEDLAARLVEVACVLLKAADLNDDLVLKAVELGRLQVLWVVYGNESRTGRKAVATRHKKSLKQVGYASSAERQTLAVKKFHEIRRTYPDKKVKVILVDVATVFGVKPETIRNWVSKDRKTSTS